MARKTNGKNQAGKPAAECEGIFCAVRGQKIDPAMLEVTLEAAEVFQPPSQRSRNHP